MPTRFKELTSSEAVKIADTAVLHLLTALGDEALWAYPKADPPVTSAEVAAALKNRVENKDVLERLQAAFLEAVSREFVILPDEPQNR